MTTVNGKAIEIFLMKIRDDSRFSRSVFAAIDPVVVQGIAQAAGIALTVNDIIASKEYLSKALATINRRELSGRDQETDVGGFGTTVLKVEEEFFKKYKW